MLILVTTLTPSRVAELEKKLDNVYNLLGTRPVQNDAAPFQVSGSSVPPAVPFGQQHPLGGVTLTGSQVGYLDTPKSLVSIGETLAFADVIGKGIVGIREAEELLEAFNHNFSNFPFLNIPLQYDLATLRHERPVLLLAVLTIASRKRRMIQEPLEREFRQILGTRLVIDFAHDLDLLQGLLTLLAWYHLGSKHPVRQMYMLVQIAVTMALDLEVETQAANGERSQRSAEVRRTFVGVYYISSSISMALRKPITMRYSRLIDDYSQSLAKLSTKASDHFLHLIQLQRITEDISDVFGYEATKQEPPTMGIEGIELSIKAFKARLDSLRSSLASDAACSSSLMLAYDHAYMHLYEVCIMFSERTEEVPKDVSHGLHLASTARATMFIKCLEALKKFLNTYLQLSSSDLASHSIIDKSRMAHALTVLIKLPFCTDTGLETSAWREACEVEYYLGALNERAEGAGARADGNDPYKNYRLSLSRLKAWYQRTVLFETSSTSSEVKRMSPIQLTDIERQEQIFNMDFYNMDFGEMDALFFPETNIWE